MDLEKLKKTLEKNGFAVTLMESAAAAADYLDAQIDGKTVGFGGSMTLKNMGMYERLSSHNTVYWHWLAADPEDRVKTLAAAATTDVYLASVNGLAESGEIINIDGAGNRINSIQFGHKKVFLVVGVNKIAPTYEKALWRARNIASPLNARRLGCQTPCAAGECRCYDCDSPQRICNIFSVLWKAPSTSSYEIVLINEELGF